MKKGFLYLISCCVCLGVFLILMAQNKTEAAEMNNAMAQSDLGIEEIAVSCDTKNISTYQFETGYAKYLEKYDENGQGGFRIDTGIRLHKLTLEFEDRRYICWFRIAEDGEREFDNYKNQFENSEWESAELIEQYPDQLLQSEEMSVYCCEIGSQSENVEDKILYTSSCIVE